MFDVNEECMPTYGDRYYSISEFEDQCENKTLILFHQNIRSFNKNYDYFSAFLNNITKTIDIIIFSET